jgi:hypothetical protein
MPDFIDLPPLRRLQRYLQLASDARREADTAQGSLKESYTLIAERWEYLAGALEETLRDGKLK